MATIYEVSDYVIFRCKAEGDTDLSVLKHQKLLYYVQAWHLAFNKGAGAFDAEFQAWIHGPVSREIYELYKDTKTMYSEMQIGDLQDNSSSEKLSEELKLHVDTILDDYAKFSATELEFMTHREEPWLEARKGFAPNERCEVVIKNETMQKYYESRLKQSE